MVRNAGRESDIFTLKKISQNHDLSQSLDRVINLGTDKTRYRSGSCALNKYCRRTGWVTGAGSGTARMPGIGTTTSCLRGGNDILTHFFFNKMHKSEKFLSAHYQYCLYMLNKRPASHWITFIFQSQFFRGVHF